MPKANRVHSTPRRTASKIGGGKAAAKVDHPQKQATAYSRLESAICDAANMAMLAGHAMCDADGGASKEEKNLAFFAVYHLCDMVRSLRETYYELEKAVA
jgi:hypothetical protein